MPREIRSNDDNTNNEWWQVNDNCFICLTETTAEFFHDILISNINTLILNLGLFKEKKEKKKNGTYKTLMKTGETTFLNELSLD